MKIKPPQGDAAPTPGQNGWVVAVDQDLVRSDPAMLELDTPDGRALRVRRTLFEDRGDGNAMWVGRYAKHDYDSVVLTLQDGYLLGHFGLPEGGAWSIRSGRDGGGRMSEEGLGPISGSRGATREGMSREDASRPPRMPSATVSEGSDEPERVVSESTHDWLDILMLYTPGAARVFADAGYGSAAAAMQQAMDYLNLVLRNSRIPKAARMIHVAPAPASLERTLRPFQALSEDRGIHALRAAHSADIVHLFTASNWNSGYCGTYSLLRGDDTAASFSTWAYGVTIVGDKRCRVGSPGSKSWHLKLFTSIVGHNLGADVNPENTDSTPDELVEPYAYGHQDTSRDPNILTAMSYFGRGRTVPFFSNVLDSPDGAIIGIAGKRENARALQRTIDIGIRYGDHIGPVRPRRLDAQAASGTSVRLTWEDRSNDETGFAIWARLADGEWRDVLRLPPNAEFAEVGGLQVGGRYRFLVTALGANGATDSYSVSFTLPGSTNPACVPAGTVATLNGHRVAMCFEDPNTGETRQPFQAWTEGDGAVLGFFDRSNPEVLVKVLDGCAHNGHRWVFVAPVTTLAFELNVTDPHGRRWTHSNAAGQTARAKSDIRAFSCGQ